MTPPPFSNRPLEDEHLQTASPPAYKIHLAANGRRALIYRYPLSTTTLLEDFCRKHVEHVKIISQLKHFKTYGLDPDKLDALQRVKFLEEKTQHKALLGKSSMVNFVKNFKN